jgi:hypothetical protein
MQLNVSRYISGEELSGMRAKSREAVDADHIIHNSIIINDIVVSSVNFGAAKRF